MVVEEQNKMKPITGGLHGLDRNRNKKIQFVGARGRRFGDLQKCVNCGKVLTSALHGWATFETRSVSCHQLSVVWDSLAFNHWSHCCCVYSAMDMAFCFKTSLKLINKRATRPPKSRKRENAKSSKYLLLSHYPHYPPIERPQSPGKTQMMESQDKMLSLIRIPTLISKESKQEWDVFISFQFCKLQQKWLKNQWCWGDFSDEEKARRSSFGWSLDFFWDDHWLFWMISFLLPDWANTSWW